MFVTLGDVCEKGSSNLAQKDIINLNGEFPIFGASGYIGNVNFYHQEESYIAVVKDGAGVGRVMLLPAKSSVIGTMQYLIPKESFTVKYLYYAVKFMHLEKYYMGAAIPHIYFKDYKNEKLKLRSVREQNQIVDVLDTIERIIEKHKQQLKKLEELIKARFVEMFDGIHDSKKYSYTLLKNITNVVSGGTPNINPVFLWKYFELSYDKLRDMAKGGNQPNLNGNILKNFPILMPPKDLQDSYVSFIQQVDKSKAVIEKSLKELETLQASLMQEYFS